ncbi:hypothetical protein F5Y14DRAFT_297217 [Nemania sp. NC0429]|nr:hypothetical protein F5Y14DRAFT_297217 [Nemania sp. NC0429]
MAPGQKMYPRATVKKIVKAHSKCNLSKNVDVMIFLDYVLFMQTLVREAAIDSKQAGERSIGAKSIRKATPMPRRLYQTSRITQFSIRFGPTKNDHCSQYRVARRLVIASRMRAQASIQHEALWTGSERTPRTSTTMLRSWPTTVDLYLHSTRTRQYKQ